MAETLRQSEEIPASYPPAPAGLSKQAKAIDAAAIWARIESYTAHRWTPRDVTWVLEGPGEWSAPLAPATVTATEVWEGDGWAAFDPTPGPMGGFVLKGAGPYRVTASVGGGAVPASVSEAYRRLAEYIAQASANAAPGVRQESADGLGSIEFDPAALARAMDRSGAGDLLRSYRRAN